MSKLVTNIVFTKNRPLQLDAYLESLYRYFPQHLIKTFIIYKVELFKEQYESVFRKFSDCIVVREGDFHSDVIDVIGMVDTKYILFGIDDVVFHDSVDLDVVNRTFDEHGPEVFGFTLRFGPDSLDDSGDIVTEVSVADQQVYKLNWKEGRTPHSRYPFELCCTFYPAATVRKIIRDSMNHNPLIRKLFCPASPLVRCMAKVCSTRSILKSFGYFFSPNTLESWLCRWCKNHPADFPGFTYFQKLCACAIQINMVNTSTKNTFDGTTEHTVEALNEKYKQGYRFDIASFAANKPNKLSCGREYFKLLKE